jgi:hypothetical protein
MRFFCKRPAGFPPQPVESVEWAGPFVEGENSARTLICFASSSVYREKSRFQAHVA